VEAKVESPWHTFAMDNTKRAEEKLAGKKAISMDRPTEVTAGAGVKIDGGWLQTPPKDFSKPQLRWFSWGYENHAVFVVKAQPAGSGPTQIGIRGQACTDSICKNIDVPLAVPAAKNAATAQGSYQDLIPVR
jgi:hypothetical protein